jgi:hypothetical protein
MKIGKRISKTTTTAFRTAIYNELSHKINGSVWGIVKYHKSLFIYTELTDTINIKK